MATFNYCTLFDSYYLTRGLALHESLTKVHSDFCLYIFAFDDNTKFTLTEMKLENAVIIGLNEFEDEELLKVKPNRSKAEYCFTCTPSVIKYAIEKYKLPSCTYLDADMYFYSSPLPAFAELNSYPVGLSPHNYSPEYDMAKDSGKYCVQFVYFKNTTEGMQPLNWWRNECIKWCYARVEDGKYGDQKYLDSFSTLFANVHDIEHAGIGVAPWNIKRFKFILKNKKIILKNNRHESEVIFYHYQSLKIDFNKKIIQLGKWYDLSEKAVELFYIPYIERLIYYENKLKNLELNIKEFKLVKENRLRLYFFFTAQKIISGNKFVRTLYNVFNKLTGNQK
jgi:hypothetical protein